MSPARALVLAKAPVPGLVKTRLGVDVGPVAAATLAAAALLDTLAACAAAFEECHLALDGTFAEAVDGPALVAATAGWQVFAQAGAGLGARLAHAHCHVAAQGSGPVVQVGMDTPQATPEALLAVAAAARPGRAVLGPALDGGWWVLGLDGLDAAAGGPALAAVPMSTPSTYEQTREALARAGLEVRAAAALRDVDTVTDAVAVAAAAPGTRFAAAWRRTRGVA